MDAPHGATTDMSLLSTACVFRKDRRKTMFGTRRDGRLVHIDDAPRLSRDFTCPDCGTPLVVKKGDIKIHHFAHKSEADCIAAGETALHRLAKAILQENHALHIPKLVILDETCQPAREVLLDSVEEETWEGRFRPDLRATMRRIEAGSETISTLFIEIHVTHEVDQEKLGKIEARGHSAIEIDLSKVNRDLTYQDLAVLLRRDAPRKWLYNRRAEAHQTRITAARERARQIQAAADAQEQRLRDEAAERARRARLRKPARSAAETAQAQRRWKAIDREAVFTIEADDGIFDLPPHEWRTIALGAIAPWADPGRASTQPRQVRIEALAHQATLDLLRAKAVKPEFMPRDRTVTGPALVAVRDYLKAVLIMVGGMATSGSGLVLHRALDDLRTDWANLEEVHDKVARLQAMLQEQGIVVTGCGRAMSSIDDTSDWIAAQRRRAGLSFGTIGEPLRGLIFELGDPRARAGVPAGQLLEMEMALHRNGTDCTAAYLQDFRDERDARLTAEAGRAVEAEVDRIMMPLQRSLEVFASIGPWPTFVTLDGLPDRLELRDIVWKETGEYHKRNGIVLRSYVDKALERQTTIIRTFSAIARVVNDLGVPVLERGVRNILVRHAIRTMKSEAGIRDLDRLTDALPTLASCAKRLAQQELAGSPRIHGTSPENFAWRALCSAEKAGDRAILQSILAGDLVNARRMTNLITTPILKPAWIRADTPRFE